MTLQDMTDLVTIHDGIREIEKAASLLCNAPTAAGYEEGALGKLSRVYNMIQRNSKFAGRTEDMEDMKDSHGNTFPGILDMKISAEERAKMLLED